MTAADLLSQYGISVHQARSWIMSNLSTPQTIFETARQFGITSNMLAEILEPEVPGVNASMVESFFTSHGLNGSLLSGSSGGIPGGSHGGNEILPAELNALASLVSFNTNSGMLSTESLRSAVIASVGSSQYNQAFNPQNYYGADDGWMTGSELGFSGFPGFAATQQNLESLYYGTLIKAFKSIDMNEIMEIQNFVTANQSGLMNGNESTLTAYMQLMVSVFQDPASTPLLNDVQLNNAIAMGTGMFVQLVGSGDNPALFDGLLTAFMGA